MYQCNCCTYKVKITMTIIILHFFLMILVEKEGMDQYQVKITEPWFIGFKIFFYFWSLYRILKMFVKRAPLSLLYHTTRICSHLFSKDKSPAYQKSPQHLALSWCIYCSLWTSFTLFFSVLIVPFEVNVAWYAPGSILHFRLNSQPLLWKLKLQATSFKEWFQKLYNWM